MKVLACATVAIGLVLGIGGIAHADIIVSNPVITPQGGNFDWAYTISLDSFERINTATQASFVTVYDLTGLIGGGNPSSYTPGALAGTLSVQNVGITPATQNPTDSPAIPNETVTFNGSAAPGSTLGVLHVRDALGPNAQAFGNFSGQATNNENGSFAANTSSVPIPAPEPGSLVLLASGVLGMVGVARRRIGSWKA